MAEAIDAIEKLRSEPRGEARKRLLAEFFALHRNRLRAAVDLRLSPGVRRRIDPSDVLQEAFLEASKNLDRYLRDPRLPFFLWLRRMTVYALYDAHRHHLGARQRSIYREEHAGSHRELEASSETMAFHLASRQPSPSALAERAETRGAIQAALDKLDANDRQVLALRALEQLTNAEAADVLGISDEAVKKRYLRALKRFKDTYGSGKSPFESGAR